MIGGFTFLKNWMIRSERNDALEKLFIRNLKNEQEALLVKPKDRESLEKALKKVITNKS